MKKILLLLIVSICAALPLVAQPVIISQPTRQPAVWGGNATFGVMVTGVGPFTYQWQLNGTNLPNNIISTFAGGQLFDGLQATNTIIGAPPNVAVDSAGNLFIADANNYVVRKVGTNGATKIVAGSGLSGFYGDGGAATNARLDEAVAVAVDTNGNLFIADEVYGRIRKVDTNGTITTFAGNGAGFGYYGDGGAATNGTLINPTGVTLDKAGNVYIADSQHHTIRKVDTSGNISTVAGAVNSSSGSYSGDNFSATLAHLNTPNSVAVDGAGNLFIADTLNYRIRKVTASTGNISTIAGTGTAGYSGDGGSATAAKINYVDGISVDTNGNIFIADTGNSVIRKITNGIISTVAGNNMPGFSGDGGLAKNASLSYPQGVTVDKLGNLFVADSANNLIRKVGVNSNITTVAGQVLTDGGLAVNASLNPVDITQDRAGNFYICDTDNHRIRKVDTNGIITTFAGNGMPAFAGDGGPATNASIHTPFGISLDGLGNLLIADQGNWRVRKVDTNGIITSVAGKGPAAFSGDGGAATNAGVLPQRVRADAFGNYFILDAAHSRIRKVDTNGIITTVAGKGTYGYTGDGGLATNATIATPSAITLDSQGNLFIAQQDQAAIRKVDTNGYITTVAGNGTPGDSGDGGQATNALLRVPYGVSTDSSGNLYISDALVGRVRKIATNGIITTLAGNGVEGFPVDNVTGNSTSLAFPSGIFPDNAGNLYIADEGVNRVRKLAFVDFADQPNFTVTNVTTGLVNNNYSVVITSASGSVTSSVASLTIQLPPIVPAFTASNGTFSFTWNAVSNFTYQLQCATNLVAPLWKNLGTPIAATNNTVSTSDFPGMDAQRFYRVQLVQ